MYRGTLAPAVIWPDKGFDPYVIQMSVLSGIGGKG